MKLIHISIINIILIFFIIGCNSNVDNKQISEASDQEVSESHEHEDENIKLILSGYNDLYEVYIEADPFVINNESKILAHFTMLSKFKPIENAAIKLTLAIGDKSLNFKIEKTDKKGIYTFAIKPEIEGIGRLIFEVTESNGTSTIEFDNIVVYSNPETAMHEAEKTNIVSPNGISFTKEKSWKVDFRTEQVELKPFHQVIRTSAIISNAPADEFVIVANASGVVSLLNKSLSAGLNVKKSEKLLHIVGNELIDNNSKTRYTEAENNYKVAKSTYERNINLVKDQIISEKEYQQSLRDYDNSKVIYDNLRKNYSETGQIVECPSNGTIQRVFVSNGQFVNAGDPILSIAKNQFLYLNGNVQYKYANQLRSIESVNIKPAEANAIYTLDQLNGNLVSIGTSTSQSSYLLPISFQVKFREDFIPGSYVELIINTKTKDKGISIPNNSLIEEQGYYSVFVQLTPELFEKREVQVGMSDGINTQILRGLTEGERIVSEGAILIKLAAVSNSLDPHAGHVH